MARLNVNIFSYAACFVAFDVYLGIGNKAILLSNKKRLMLIIKRCFYSILFMGAEG